MESLEEQIDWSNSESKIKDWLEKSPEISKVAKALNQGTDKDTSSILEDYAKNTDLRQSRSFTAKGY